MNRSKNNRTRHAAIETLEGRRLMSATLVNGTLTVVGQHISTVDEISVSEESGNIVVREGTTGDSARTTSHFPAAAVTTIDINAGDGPDRVYMSVEFKKGHINAGEGDDRVYLNNRLASAERFVVWGQGGNDVIFGSPSSENLYGGTGNDFILGQAGDDAIYADSGNDSLYGETGNDQIYGQVGNDRVDGGDGHDILHGSSGNDSIYGGSGNDRITDDYGQNRLYGDAGDDIITATSLEQDVIYGGDGYDTVYYKASGAYNIMSGVESKNAV
jgi:Ca2+-binding RTX toxin-like protein